MLHLEDIKEIYLDSILIEKTGENVAVDLNSGSRVITLVDGKIMYRERENHELYIPGKSYILPFRTVRETVLSRVKIVVENFIGRKNIYPEIVGMFVKGLDPIEYYRNMNAQGRFQFPLGSIESMVRSKLEELTNFSKICKDRTKGSKIDMDGFTVLQGLNPIKQITTGYELDGVFYSTDTIGKINSPLEIEANESEFSFLSKEYAKITDSDRKVGKFREGMLTLTDPSININNIDYTVKKRSGEFLLANIYTIRNTLAGALVGFSIGTIPGCLCGIFPITWGLAVLAYPNILEKNYFEGLMQVMLGYTAIFGTGCSLWGGTLAYLDSRNPPKVPKILREKVSGTGLMNMAFHGNLKNKRIENIKDILTK